MPAKTQAQYNLMQAVLHGSAKKKGISKSVAREFTQGGPPKADSKTQSSRKKRKH